MALPQPSLNLINDWFVKNELSVACPLCGNDFELNDCEFVFLNSVSRASATGEQIIETVAITCHNCGNVRLFDARMMGFKFNHAANGKTAPG